VSVDQFASLTIALVGLASLLLKVWLEVRRVHQLVNSRMTELLELTRSTAKAAGVLEGESQPSQRPRELP
jgi:uncharacterized membrane protein YhaH (DUF805 family)